MNKFDNLFMWTIKTFQWIPSVASFVHCWSTFACRFLHVFGRLEQVAIAKGYQRGENFQCTESDVLHLSIRFQGKVERCLYGGQEACGSKHDHHGAVVEENATYSKHLDKHHHKLILNDHFVQSIWNEFENKNSSSPIWLLSFHALTQHYFQFGILQVHDVHVYAEVVEDIRLVLLGHPQSVQREWYVDHHEN